MLVQCRKRCVLVANSLSERIVTSFLSWAFLILAFSSWMNPRQKNTVHDHRVEERAKVSWVKVSFPLACMLPTGSQPWSITSWNSVIQYRKDFIIECSGQMRTKQKHRLCPHQKCTIVFSTVKVNQSATVCYVYQNSKKWTVNLYKPSVSMILSKSAFWSSANCWRTFCRGPISRIEKWPLCQLRETFVAESHFCPIFSCDSWKLLQGQTPRFACFLSPAQDTRETSRLPFDLVQRSENSLFRCLLFCFRNS